MLSIMSALIVDASSFSRASLQMILGRQKLDDAGVETADEAITLLAEWAQAGSRFCQFSVAYIDWNLGGSSGVELVDEICSRSELACVQIVMLDDAPSAERSFLKPFALAAYLAKLVDGPTVIKSLEQALRN